MGIVFTIQDRIQDNPIDKILPVSLRLTENIL